LKKKIKRIKDHVVICGYGRNGRQAAAELLGCSRPHIVKLLEDGQISYTKVGKHRRVKYEDVIKYKNALKAKQKAAIREIIQLDEESGLYDT
jgi:excisionase family DNA binding protein